MSHITTSNSTYPVTVTLDDATVALPNGTPAAVEVTVSTVSDVTTVPTSALSDGTVLLVTEGSGGAEGTVTRTRVRTGVIGSAMTEVRAGLRPGQQVVLADLEAALPTTSTSSSGSRGGLGSGIGSGGFTPPRGGFGGR